VIIPAFDSDVDAVVGKLFEATGPAYLRLGLSEEPKGYVAPPFGAWRKLVDGAGPTVVVVGPMVGGILGAVREAGVGCSLWLVSELPFGEVPGEMLADLEKSGRLVVVEEHVSAGSAGQQLAHRLMEMGRAPRRFEHRTALGYVSGLYGSQRFHRAECGLDPASIVQLVGRR
jgi:transketolase